MKSEQHDTLLEHQLQPSGMEGDASLSHQGEWLNLPGVLLFEAGTIRLREPPGSDVSKLLKQLWRGSYSKPFVLDDGIYRRLYFSLETVQSKMSIDEPYALAFAYTRKMMAFLLFVPRPKHIVIVGLGGGSLTKFCYRQLPRTRVTTVEVDAEVIHFGKLFHVPTQDKRMRIINADAVEYFATTNESADAILIDGCDRSGVAPAFCNKQFYMSLRDRLRPQGVLVMNLVGAARIVKAHLQHIAEAFTGQILVRQVDPGCNLVLFAFKDPAYLIDWSEIERSSQRLAQRHGLDFPIFAQKLRHAGKIVRGTYRPG